MKREEIFSWQPVSRNPFAAIFPGMQAGVGIRPRYSKREAI